jgi:hypothetical protein
MEPSSGGQQLILAKVYKWFKGAIPYIQYCGVIRKPMCVCTARYTEGDSLRQSPSVHLAVHTHRLSYAATILTTRTISIEPFVHFS